MNNIYKSNIIKKSEYLSKFTICSYLILICILIWIPFVILTSISFNKYGWAVNEPGFNIPIQEQCYRLWMLLFSSLILLLGSFSFYFAVQIMRYANVRYFLLSFGFFSWAFLVHLIILNMRVDYFKVYKNYLNYYITNNYQISLYYLFFNFKWDKLSRNTILYIFAFLCSFVGFIFILIPNLDNNAYLSGTFIYNSLSFFTRLTNIGCFLVLLFFSYFQLRTFNKNNTLNIYMCSYILVVAVIYWVVLFPKQITNGSFEQKSDFAKTESIWLHLITPITFIWFMINCSSLNLLKPEHKFIKHFTMINVYPLWYFTYSYFISFLVKESVYGSITNLNPNAYIYEHNTFIKNGNPLYVFTIFAFGLIFILAFLLFRIINVKITNNVDFYRTKHSMY